MERVRMLESGVIQVCNHLVDFCYFPNICKLVGHGGYGFTSRAWGLTLDTIVALDVVLADGTILTASAVNHPDLFWVCH